MLKAIPRYKCVQTFFIKVCCDTLLLPYLLLPTTQKYDSTVWHILNLDQSTLQELNFEIIPNDSFIFLALTSYLPSFLAPYLRKKKRKHFSQ